MICARTSDWSTAAILGLVVWAGGCTPSDEDISDTGIQTIPDDQTEPVEAGTSSDATASPEAYRGAGLARQVCAQCHNVTGGSDPLPAGSAPSFRSVANRPGMTADALTAWLRSTHPTMPNYKFGAAETEELVAYIIGLREH